MPRSPVSSLTAARSGCSSPSKSSLTIAVRAPNDPSVQGTPSKVPSPRPCNQVAPPPEPAERDHVRDAVAVHVARQHRFGSAPTR